MSELIYEIVEAGYDQDNPVPRLEPVRINSKIYIFNRICGIVLEKRGKEDNHVIFTLISSDDGFWYRNGNHTYSNCWLEDFNKLIEYVKNYMKISDNFETSKFGYNFKENKNEKTCHDKIG